MSRLSKLSVENLKVADHIVLREMYTGDNKANVVFMVTVYKNGNCSILHDGFGDIMLYPSPYRAIRACKRHSDIQPTTI